MIIIIIERIGKYMNKTVTIIIPVYNSERYLKRCLDSVINQTYKDIEVILIDDGSKDDSKIIYNAYVNEYKFIHAYYQENQGVSSARNLGLEKSNGDFIFFCDSDDYLEVNAIEIMINAMTSFDLDMVASSYNVVSDCKNKNEKLLITNFSDLLEPPVMLDLILNPDEIAGYLWNKLFRKSFINKGVEFDTNIAIGEDLLFCVEYLIKCKRFMVIDHYLYNYCLNSDSITNSSYGEKNLTYILALDKIISCLKNNIIFNRQSRQLAYQIIRLSCSSFFYIMFKKIKNKKRWMRFLIDIYKKYSSHYGCNKKWSLKEKMKYVILFCISYIC